MRVAHERGLKVVGHVTSSDNLALLVKMGVDQVAHMPYETVPKELMKKVIAKKLPVMPTITVFDGYGVASGAKENLAQFHKAGGAIIALGDDFGGGAGTVRPRDARARTIVDERRRNERDRSHQERNERRRKKSAESRTLRAE